MSVQWTHTCQSPREGTRRHTTQASTLGRVSETHTATCAPCTTSAPRRGRPPLLRPGPPQERGQQPPQAGGPPCSEHTRSGLLLHTASCLYTPTSIPVSRSDDSKAQAGETDTDKPNYTSPLIFPISCWQRERDNSDNWKETRVCLWRWGQPHKDVLDIVSNLTVSNKHPQLRAETQDVWTNHISEGREKFRRGNWGENHRPASTSLPTWHPDHMAEVQPETFSTGQSFKR